MAGIMSGIMPQEKSGDNQGAVALNQRTQCVTKDVNMLTSGIILLGLHLVKVQYPLIIIEHHGWR